MSEQDDPASAAQRLIANASAGAGLGGLLLVIADHLPPDSPLKTPLIIASPVASAAVGTLWGWAHAAARRRQRKKLLQRLLAEAKSTIASASHDPALSSQQISALQNDHYRLTRMQLDAEMRKIELLLSEDD